MSFFCGNNKNYVCYDEKSFGILNKVDEKFRSIALGLGAVEYHIPAMIDKDILAKCDYFSKFPQHLTVAAHAKRDAYHQISIENEMNTSSIEISQQYFTPAACIHIYPMLENQAISQKAITTKARVYRYEDESFNGATRLWDFTVREIVFVGSAAYVRDSLEKMKQVTLEYLNVLGIDAKLCIATDCFYPSKKNTIKKKLQYSNSLKYEITTCLEGEPVALASFNYHGSHFSKTFNFDKDETIVTGCVGFGLERWVYSLMINAKTII